MIWSRSDASPDRAREAWGRALEVATASGNVPEQYKIARLWSESLTGSNNETEARRIRTIERRAAKKLGILPPKRKPS